MIDVAPRSAAVLIASVTSVTSWKWSRWTASGVDEVRGDPRAGRQQWRDPATVEEDRVLADLQQRGGPGPLGASACSTMITLNASTAGPDAAAEAVSSAVAADVTV